MNRSLSIRSKGKDGKGSGGRHLLSMNTLRGFQQPEASKRLFKIIKNENEIVGAYESAGRDRIAVASQLSEWGESTTDDAISDISDKLGVLLAEIGEQEDNFAQNLEDYRGVLKQIRNMESSVQPTRTDKVKIADEIQKLKYKDPASTKLVSLEHELVRAEAQNLVAEAQLSNITRQKFKEGFDIHLAAVIERAEKQIILARHARRLLHLIDDSPVVPGDARKTYEYADEAREVLADAENDLRAWKAVDEPIPTSSNELGSNLMPRGDSAVSDVAAPSFVSTSETDTVPSERLLDPSQTEAQVQAVEASLRAEKEKEAAAGTAA